MGDNLDVVMFPWTANPTVHPSIVPARPMEDPNNGPFSDPTVKILFIAILTVLLFTVLLIGWCFWKIQNTQSKVRRELSLKMSKIPNVQKVDSLETRQGVVACIAIGEYDNSEYDELPVVRDVGNLRKFSNFMGYDFIERPNKLHWTEEEIKSFLMKDIGNNLFDQNANPKYDVLIICFSGHGVRDCVVTSDSRHMDRTVMHRMISLHFPKIRDVPRIFVFDACAGTRVCIAKGAGRQHEDEVSVPKVTLSDGQNEVIGKNTDTEDVKEEEAWTTETKNPDYKLIVINSSNIGFQSRMRGDQAGSYLIHHFTQKIMKNAENHEDKSIAEIMTEIQKKLHDEGTQQIECVFNNGTRNLRLEINLNEEICANE